MFAFLVQVRLESQGVKLSTAHVRAETEVEFELSRERQKRV